MELKTFYDKDTNTLTYIVYDLKSKDAVIIDPVLNYDPAASSIGQESNEEVIQFIRSKSLRPHYILETHAHADHLTGAQGLKQAFDGIKIGIGSRIVEVQQTFKELYNIKDLKTDGSQFDKLLKDGEVLQAGTIKIKTLHTPGHTPACVTYLIGDMAFTGDALFMPDSGTGRCDFPAGSATDLYNSITKKIYTLPEKTRTFTGHDYQPNGRELAYQSTVGEHKKNNIRLRADMSQQEFVKFREERDKELKAPRLLLPSLQVNIRAGKLPHAEDNGTSYLKIPIRVK